MASFDLRTYPDTHLIYEEVAKWLKVKNDQIIIHEGADGGLLRVFDVLFPVFLSTATRPKCAFL